MPLDKRVNVKCIVTLFINTWAQGFRMDYRLKEMYNLKHCLFLSMYSFLDRIIA